MIKKSYLCQWQAFLDTELRIVKKKCFFTVLYRSPSQTFNELEDFCTDLNVFLSNVNDLNPACSVITGEFNARSPQWWGLDKENNQGPETSFLEESSSYTDLIFKCNPSFIIASGVELSLYEKCHYNLIYGKINLMLLFRNCIHMKFRITKMQR